MSYIPGPWGIEQTDTHNWIGPMRPHPSKKVMVVVVDNHRGLGLKPESVKVADANARLISAAPELLEACKRALKHLEDGTLVRDITKDGNSNWAINALALAKDLSQLQAAILKAEGNP